MWRLTRKPPPHLAGSLSPGAGWQGKGDRGEAGQPALTTDPVFGRVSGGVCRAGSPVPGEPPSARSRRISQALSGETSSALPGEPPGVVVTSAGAPGPMPAADVR